MSAYVDFLFHQIGLYEGAPSERRKAQTILANAGYTLCGKGSRGAVYQKPGSKYVLKLYDSWDVAYSAFIDLAMTNPNPHFPRFVGKKVKVTNQYNAIRIEPLTPFTTDSDVADYLFDYICTTRDRKYRSVNVGYRLGSYEYVTSKPKLKMACDLVADLLGKNPSFFSDIHGDNIMLRGSTLVLSDPVATET